MEKVLYPEIQVLVLSSTILFNTWVTTNGKDYLQVYLKIGLNQDNKLEKFIKQCEGALSKDIIFDERLLNPETGTKSMFRVGHDGF